MMEGEMGFGIAPFLSGARFFMSCIYIYDMMSFRGGRVRIFDMIVMKLSMVVEYIC